MININLKLSDKLFEKEVEKKATRDGFGEGVVLAGDKDKRVVVLCSDVTESTRCQAFKEKFPDRFIETGVAEQSLITVASGIANYGKIPFACAFAVFSPGRTWEQIRTTVCLNDVPVKIAGHHAGLVTGGDGATHQSLEDIALMRTLPNMVVIVPCDAIEARKATLAAAVNNKPTYLRFSREPMPTITSEETPFEIGKSEIFWESKDPQVVIVACGHLVYEALLAAKELEEANIGTVVVNCHTIKPIDEVGIVNAAKLTGAVVTVEEHQIIGGLGSAVSELLVKNYPVPIEFVGVKDQFGESGRPEELLQKFGLKAIGIKEAVKRVIRRKQAN